MSKRVLNMFWGIFFRKIFCPVFHGGSSLRKFSKKSKIFQNSKQTQTRSHSCPNVFWTCFGVIISKNFFAHCSLVGRVFENSQKNQKLFKIAKMPKIFPKSVQTWFEHVLGYIFRNFFLPSVPWRVESSKIFKQIKKLSKVQNCPQSFPKESKRVLYMFWAIFSKIFFAQCSLEGRVFENFQKNRNFLKIAKMPEIVPRSVQTCFAHV